MKIGYKLRMLRKSSQLKQEEIAQTLGISQSKYARWENDLTEPSFSDLEKLANMYGITMGDFFNVNNNDILNDNLKNDLIRSVIKMLIDQGLIEKNKNFNELDEDSQNIIISALNKFIKIVAEENENSSQS